MLPGTRTTGTRPTRAADLTGRGTRSTIPDRACAVLYDFREVGEEVPSVNHARIAAEALRFRLATLQDTIVDARRFDVDRAAACAVGCADPDIDAAIRRLGTAWVRAGLDPARMCEPWLADDAELLLATGGSTVIDALDDIVRGVNRQAVFT